MSGIEWQGTCEVQPSELELAAFCRAKGIPPPPVAAAEGLLVFIDRRALEGLHDFLAHDLEREHGGVLVGQPYREPGRDRYFLDLQAAIPALETEGSPVHLQFTAGAWGQISGLLEEDFPDLLVAGWYHSHPALGVFMSPTDRATQAAFFGKPWNVAAVADPIARETGWFAGADCLPLSSGAVVVYDLAGPATRPAEHGQVAGQTAGREAGREAVQERGALHPAWPAAPELRWLLPFGVLLGGLLVLAFRRGRVPRRAGSNSSQ